VPGNWAEEHALAGEDIGGGHYVHRMYRLPNGTTVSYPADHGPPEGSVFVGLHDYHRTDTTQTGWCGGWVGFTNVEGADERAVHELVSAEPLHVEPSLGCRGCPSHGWIREGRWSEAG
jgi:hypothetical protein